ncbi:MAG: hypothetical protein JXA99_10705 [Candidatus Lokiarchaeota archaeon]|nr:hypothetical protein [Candidatus Lokiarchaeota archaeon]
MSFGYCRECKQNVLLKREKINIPLAILLLIFSAGIGLLIYIWIHNTKSKNVCIHCGNYATPIENNKRVHNQLYTYNQTNQNKNNPYLANIKDSMNYREESLIEISGEKINHCSLCGHELDNNNPEYCAFCGEKL